MTQRARVRLDVQDLLPSLRQYLSAASLVFARTWGKILAYAYCARQAALLGVGGWVRRAVLCWPVKRGRDRWHQQPSPKP